MVLVCQQPHYLPWLGYFELFARADSFVILDSVQWIRSGRQHRTRILQKGGSPLWLTIPVQGSGHREKALKDLRIDPTQNWARRHWETVRANYGRAPYFQSQVEPLLRPFFEKAKAMRFLTEISEESLWLFWDAFRFSAAISRSSELPESGVKSERLLGLCRELGATEYYSSLGSTRYLDLSLFREAGVRVRWQHFRANFPGDLRRPADLSVLDWVAHIPLADIRKLLHPSPPLGVFLAGGIEGEVPMVHGRHDGA